MGHLEGVTPGTSSQEIEDEPGHGLELVDTGFQKAGTIPIMIQPDPNSDPILDPNEVILGVIHCLCMAIGAGFLVTCFALTGVRLLEFCWFTFIFLL